jgi:hypothetical protein
MSIFKPVTLSYAGKNYTVAATKLLPLLAQIEDVITLQDLTNVKGAPIVKLSQAYGLALRYAGADVSDEEIYESVFSKSGAGFVTAAVSGLLSMMIPPTKFQNAVSPSAAALKKPKPKNKN